VCKCVRMSDVSVCVYTLALKRECVRARKSVYVVCMCLCVYVCMRMCVYVCMCMCVYLGLGIVPAKKVAGEVGRLRAR
jgi:hypothetical protein